MAVIDPERTWQPLERLLADTTDARRRAVLSVVIEHMKAEAEPDMDRLMATLGPAPDYHFWIDGQNAGPNGTDGVRAYYTAFVESGANVLEFEIDRLVLDDDCLVTEGWLKVLYPGAAAAGIGIPVPDPAGDYLVVFRQLILWPVDADGLIQGEDAYHSGPVSVTALSHADLPDKYLAMTEGRPRTHA
ncbi:MAG: nuclear transport factor 2 family protein [Mycobacterium sp.]